MHNAQSGLGLRIQNLGASSLLTLFLGCTMHNAQSRLGQRIQNFFPLLALFSGVHNAQCKIKTWRRNLEFSPLSLLFFWAAQCTMHNPKLGQGIEFFLLPLFWRCTMHNSQWMHNRCTMQNRCTMHNECTMHNVCTLHNVCTMHNKCTMPSFEKKSNKPNLT